MPSPPSSLSSAVGAVDHLPSKRQKKLEKKRWSERNEIERKGISFHPKFRLNHLN